MAEFNFTPIHPTPATTPVSASRKGSMLEQLEHDNVLKCPRAPNSVAELVLCYGQKACSTAAKYVPGSKQHSTGQGAEPTAGPSVNLDLGEIDETFSRLSTAPSAAASPGREDSMCIQLPNQIVDELVPDATATQQVSAPATPSASSTPSPRRAAPSAHPAAHASPEAPSWRRLIGTRPVYAARATNRDTLAFATTPGLLWVPYQRAGKFMMVAAATSSQWGLQSQRAPESLLATIAKHTPQHQPGYVLRQPSCAHAVTPTTSSHHHSTSSPHTADSAKSSSSSSASSRPAICSRVQPVNAQLINAGLLGVFIFDPNAWQCCNTAKVKGWRMYQDHACAHCKERAASNCNAP